MVTTQTDTAMLGAQVYEAIIVEIEPELTIGMLPRLKELYKNEVDADRRARFIRYEKAFAKYDEAYAKYLEHCNDLIARSKQTARQSAEIHSRQQEASEQSQLLNQIALV